MQALAARALTKWQAPGWRSRLARASVVLCVGIATVTVLVRAPRAIETLDGRANEMAALSYDDREFAAGNSIIPDKTLLYMARAQIPPRGTFRVITGPLPINDIRAFTLTAAQGYATYFLMPRRPSASSRWVICLGCDPKAIGTSVHVVWSNDAGSSLLRVGQ